MTTAIWATGWLLRDGKAVAFPAGVGDHGIAVLNNPQAFGMPQEVADDIKQQANWTLRYTAATNWMFEQGHSRFSIKGVFAFFETLRVDDEYLRKIVDLILEHGIKIDTVTVDGALDHRQQEFHMQDLMQKVGMKTIDRFLTI